MSQLIDIFLHLDKHLAVVVEQWGPWIYALLFLIIFVETGLVVMPFCRAIRSSSSVGRLPQSAAWILGC